MSEREAAALKVYEETVKQIDIEYKTSNIQAWEAFKEKWLPAWKAYKEVLAQVDEEYAETTPQIELWYKLALKQARRTFEAALGLNLEGYLRTATRADEEAYDEAMTLAEKAKEVEV